MQFTNISDKTTVILIMKVSSIGPERQQYCVLQFTKNHSNVNHEILHQLVNWIIQKVEQFWHWDIRYN